MARHDHGQLPDRVRALAAPLAQTLDVEVLDVEVGGPRNRPLIRVIADVADPADGGGLDVEVVATLSRRLSNTLDEHDLVAGPFTLEVTSPGVERPLRAVRDFQRNLGRDVRITRTPGTGDPVTGRLVAVDDEEVTLEVDGADVRVAFTDLDHGKVVLPW